MVLVLVMLILVVVVVVLVLLVLVLVLVLLWLLVLLLALVVVVVVVVGARLIEKHRSDAGPGGKKTDTDDRASRGLLLCSCTRAFQPLPSNLKFLFFLVQLPISKVQLPIPQSQKNSNTFFSLDFRVQSVFVCEIYYALPDLTVRRVMLGVQARGRCRRSLSRAKTKQEVCGEKKRLVKAHATVRVDDSSAAVAAVVAMAAAAAAVVAAVMVAYFPDRAAVILGSNQQHQ